MPFTSQPLVPKNPKGPLRALILGRISTEHQNIENIDASYRFVENFIKTIYQGPLDVKYLGERASGMLADRETIVEAKNEIATGTWDLVIAEDISRFYRNPAHQIAFVQNAVDKDTRVICIADNLDTADEHWQNILLYAAVRHGLYVPDVCRRVRRTADNSFHHGGMVGKVRFGYRKLTKEEADSGQFGTKGLRIIKMEECTPVLQEMKSRILSGHSYAAVADWLTAR